VSLWAKITSTTSARHLLIAMLFVLTVLLFVSCVVVSGLQYTTLSRSGWLVRGGTSLPGSPDAALEEESSKLSQSRAAKRCKLNSSRSRKKKSSQLLNRRKMVRAFIASLFDPSLNGQFATAQHDGRCMHTT
jgi:hypothetical protein